MLLISRMVSRYDDIDVISMPVREEIICAICPEAPETFSISVMPEKKIIMVHIFSIAEAAPETELTMQPALLSMRIGEPESSGTEFLIPLIIAVVKFPSATERKSRSPALESGKITEDIPYINAGPLEKQKQESLSA